MAASSHTRGERRAVTAGGEQDLPNGSCNYRDLAAGPRAPTCGCIRFWLNFTAQDGDSQRAWCFCGHHACFHKGYTIASQQQQSQQQQQQPQPQPQQPHQQHREQGQALTVSRLNAITSMGHQPNEQTMEGPSTQVRQLTGLGITSGPQTLVQRRPLSAFDAINGFARAQEDSWTSDTNSRLPSTNAPTLVEGSRSSPDRIIQQQLQADDLIATQPDYPMEVEPTVPAMGTPTEPNTPTPTRSPVLGPNDSVSPGHLRPSRFVSRPVVTEPTAPLHPPPPTAVPPQLPAAIQAPISVRNLHHIVQAFGQRIESLESLSFSNVPAEDINDRFELFDGRLLDLEQWRTDHERAHSSPEPESTPPTKRRRLLPTETSAFASGGSSESGAAVDTEAAVMDTAATNAETNPRLEEIESRVLDLETRSLPSFARPWQVQVILLPWGRGLGGIWHTSDEAAEHALKSGTQNTEEWTGAQSVPKISFKSSTKGAWTTESIQAWAHEAQEWLSPRGCGPNGNVYHRLASRGFIRDITFTAPDARHIWSMIGDAFKSVDMPRVAIESEEVSRFQGLSEPFIPLRKIRKSSRLRFLSPAEMVTSATWTAGFLEPSVFMKVPNGERRLYITTPEAYLQPSEPGCSWKQIRKLPIYGASAEERAIQTANAAIEECWTFDGKLDHVVSVNASFNSRDPQDKPSVQPRLSKGKEPERRPLSPRSEARPRHHRTVSLPSSGSAGERAKDVLAKRRVASFEPGGPSEQKALKRRRISGPAEAVKRGVNFTPCRSRETPSPFTSDAAVEARSQGTSSRRQGTTSVAYATPYSHHLLTRMELMACEGGDTEANTEIAAEHSDRDEEEWEGVEDGKFEGNPPQGDRERVIEEFEKDIDE